MSSSISAKSAARHPAAAAARRTAPSAAEASSGAKENGARDQQPVRPTRCLAPAGGARRAPARPSSWSSASLAGAGPSGPRPEVEPARMEGVEHAELLHDGQRRLVPGLHRARAEPDPGRWRGDLPQQQRRLRAGHAGGEMVLGHPVAVVAELLGPPGQVDACGAGRRRRRPRPRSAPGRGSTGVRSRATRPSCRRRGEAGPDPACQPQVSAQGRRSRIRCAATPRSCSSGTTVSTNSSSPPGVRCGTRMKPSQASVCT